MKYKYFASFSHQRGFGSVTIVLPQKLEKEIAEGTNVLNDIADKITQDLCLENVVILFFKRL